MPGAVAPIRPLAWELKYAESVALKKQKKKKKKKKKKKEREKERWVKPNSAELIIRKQPIVIYLSINKTNFFSISLAYVMLKKFRRLKLVKEKNKGTPKK